MARLRQRDVDERALDLWRAWDAEVMLRIVERAGADPTSQTAVTAAARAAEAFAALSTDDARWVRDVVRRNVAVDDLQHEIGPDPSRTVEER
jgi:hypothetical protein